MMKRGTPEFLAIPVTIVVLGVIFVILLAADAGLAVFLAVGAVALVAIVVFAAMAMRRPRHPAVTEGSVAFEGSAPPTADRFNRVLLVVDSACTASELESVTGGHATSETKVFVVAPAVSSRMARLTGDEHAYTDAQGNVDAAVNALAGLGVDASGHVGSHDPLQAADEALREFPADEIVFALRGADETEWLEQGVPEIGRSRYAVPVRDLRASAHADAER
jgi:hypothetical protein